MFNFFLYLVLSLFLLVCVLLVLLVLIQKGRGGGLSSAFGGAGGNTAFGSKTGDVLTWVTSAFFLLFLSLAVVSDRMAGHVPAKTTPTLVKAPGPTAPQPANPVPSTPLPPGS
jgi:preprotein translocase subunit SecG